METSNAAHRLISVAVGGFLLAACSVAGGPAPTTTEPVSGPAPSLVAVTRYSAALIQWVASGKSLSGTYDGLVVNPSAHPTSASQSHCAVAGVADDQAITVTLRSCTDPNADGSYFGRIHGVALSLDEPTASGAVSSLDFSPGTPARYNAAVASLDLYVVQANALTSYIETNAQSQAFFSPDVSPLFQTPQGTDDIVTYQTNTAMNHAQALWSCFVLHWDGPSKSWLQVATIGPGLNASVLPFPGSFTVLNLDGTVGIAVTIRWMTYEGIEVLGDFGGHWQLVPQNTPKSDGLVDDATLLADGSISEAVTRCISTKCKTRTISLAYERDDRTFAPNKSNP